MDRGQLIFFKNLLNRGGGVFTPQPVPKALAYMLFSFLA